MPQAEGTTPAPSDGHKVIVYVLGTLVLVHSLIIALWLMPDNPVREAVSEAELSAYINPYFAQDWQNFDPALEQVDENLRIRAYIRDLDTGERKTTEWVDLTKDDNDDLRHDPNPGRIHLVSRRIATNLNAAMYALNLVQRGAVGLNYVDKPIDDLRIELIKSGGSRSTRDAVERYLRMDQIATRYASMYARSAWEGRILQVQYGVGHRNVPDYDNRGKADLADEEFRYFAFGWRKPFVASPSEQSAFDDHVDR